MTNSKDTLVLLLMRIFAIFVIFLFLIIVFVLVLKAKPILLSKPAYELMFSSLWSPFKGQFGFFPFIVGTLEVTLLALLLAVPVCLLTSIFLSEYASTRFRELTMPFIDILAGIPSVVYGLCGVLAIVPIVKYVGQMLGYETTGYCLLSAGIILAVMVFPLIISVSTEVLRSVPFELRESALGLGATKWETTRHIVFRKALQGIIAAVVLGFSRAFGETIAVLMVVGNVVQLPSSIFDAGYTLPSLIANNYGEMMSIPLYDSALMLAALILLIVVAGFNALAHYTLLKLEWRTA